MTPRTAADGEPLVDRIKTAVHPGHRRPTPTRPRRHLRHTAGLCRPPRRERWWVWER